VYDQIVEFQVAYASTIKALLAGTMVSAVCSIIGCFIILRRMAFMADAISHSMIAGIIGGYLIIRLILIAQPGLFKGDAQAPAMIIGAMLAGLLTVGMISFVTRVSRVKEDTAIGIMYTGIFALGGYVASLPQVSGMIHFHLYDLVVGNVLAVSNGKLMMMASITAIVFSCVLLFFRSFQLVSFDPVMAASIGIPVVAIDYLMTACTSLVVVSGVNLAGVILVVALIITPAASAYLLFDQLKKMLVAAALFGVAGFWLGYAFAVVSGTAAGATIVLTMTMIFLGTLFCAPRYGLIADVLRRASSVPQQLKEDVLGYLMRNNKRAAISDIVARMEGQGLGIRRAIRKLDRQNLLDVSAGLAVLTEAGEIEAIRLLRAHRLWETYLEKMGTPTERVHEIAHHLEHVSDNATVDYLDDRLGHPIRDPHGSEIPQDIHLQVGKVVSASLLREGNRAKVVKISDPAHASQLAVDMLITTLPRSADGDRWTFQLPNGKTCVLDHQGVDQILVEVIEANPR
jgi:manganese/iron transport system permease protein/iron/zinc/copper transport system permease protein